MLLSNTFLASCLGIGALVNKKAITYTLRIILDELYPLII